MPKLCCYCFSPKIVWFQNGCNKVAIELCGVQFWSEIMPVISNRTSAIERAHSARSILKSCIWFQIKLHSTPFNYHYLQMESDYDGSPGVERFLHEEMSWNGPFFFCFAVKESFWRPGFFIWCLKKIQMSVWHMHKKVNFRSCINYWVTLETSPTLILR